MVGYDKCPKWLHDAYIRGCKNTCMNNDCSKKNPEAHRIIRGNKGGLYTVAKFGTRESNVIMLCKKHHEELHSKENIQVSRQW